MTPAGLHEAAVRGSAAWCDAVSRAAGVPGRWTDDAWVQPAPAPPLFPNVATLRPGVALVEVVAEAMAARRDGAWSVKDGFADADLSVLGLRVLFEATWLARPASRAAAPGAGAPTRDLAGWEAAWAAATGGAPVDRLFPDALLADPAFGAWRHGAAGLLAHAGAEVVTVSNAFGRPRDLWALVDAVAAHHAPLPVVVYGGAALEAALASRGFRPLGPLRVWTT